MVDEQELREKIGRLEQIKTQLQTAQNQQEFVDELVENHKEAIETVGKYAEQDEEQEMFVPVGGNAHIRSKVSGGDKVLIGLGSDISALTDAEKAADIMEKRKKELTQTKTTLENTINQLTGEYQKLENEVQREYQEFQSQMQE